MVLRPSALALVRLGLFLLVFGLLCGLWELLAAQLPESPFHVGVLPGPIEKLRTNTITVALCLLLAAWLLPFAAPGKEPRRWVIAIYAGVTLSTLSLVYGAATGMVGVQLLDPRLDAQVMIVTRMLGYTVLVSCSISFAWSAIRRAPRGWEHDS